MLSALKYALNKTHWRPYFFTLQLPSRKNERTNVIHLSLFMIYNRKKKRNSEHRTERLKCNLLPYRQIPFWMESFIIILTSRDITIINILLEITYLSRYIKEQSNGTLKLKYFAIQTQIILWTFRISPNFFRWSLRISIEFCTFKTFDGIL